MPTQTLFSVGHSNHTFQHFLGLLQRHAINAIADVRSSPYSKFNPQFNQQELRQALAAHSIAYVFLGEELGARRLERACYVAGKVDYGQVAETSAFREGIQRLLDGAGRMNIAMMCAEKDPLTCHRSILVARQLRESTISINHILADGSVETHAQAETRLLRECKLQNQDFLITDSERLELAYQMRGEQIAFKETNEGKEPHE